MKKESTFSSSLMRLGMVLLLALGMLVSLPVTAAYAATTAITLTSSANPSIFGDSVTFIATVSPSLDGGTVAFKDNNMTITGCEAQPVIGGQATCALSSLTERVHPITAEYSGNTGYDPSVSAAIYQGVYLLPAVSAGVDHTCGLKDDGTLACWGHNDYGQATVPAPNTNWVQVSAYASHTCGLKADGTLACWGDNSLMQITVPEPNSNWVQVSVGALHTCGLKADGTLSCWGDINFGETIVPAPNANWVQVSAGDIHACGLKTDSTLACWGANWFGETAVPEPNENWAQVSAGGMNTCGLKTDGALVCWGWNRDGQIVVPAPNESWIQVEVGGGHTCGLKADGILACWGENTLGQTTVSEPNENWAQVSAGDRHTCGLKADGTIACWGFNGYGQAPVITLAPNTLPDAALGEVYTQNLSASGGSAAPYAFLVLSGAIPTGLTLNTDGTWSGAPTILGVFNFTVRSKDANNLATTRSYSIMVNKTVTTTTLASSANPSLFGASVTFTTTVSPTPNGGTVAFKDNGTAITGCDAKSLTSGQAACTPSILTAGSHVITAEYSGNQTYSSSSGALSSGQQVNQAVPVITWANLADIVYGTALGGVQLNATANTPGAFTYTPAAGAVLTVGTHTLHVDFVPTATTNYSNTSKDVSITVTQATPVITWSNPANIVYGTSLSGTQLNATANTPGAFTYIPASGSVLSTGTHTLHVDFVPTDTTNYSNTSKDVSITVTQAASVIIWSNPANIIYGTALSATQLNATANTTGAFTYTPAADTLLNVGTHTLHVDFVPDDTLNYTDTSKDVSITVTQVAPVLTWANPSNIAYGSALSSTQLNATANTTGAFTYTPAAGAILDVGTHTLHVDFVPADSTNYSPASKDVSLIVTQAAPILTWSAPADIVYGTALNGTQLNATADVPGNFTYTPASGAILNAGTHTLYVDFVPTDAVYYSNTSKDVSITVTQAASVIIWSNPANIIYGTALSATQLNATANTTGAFTYTPAADTLLNVGTHTLHVDFVPDDTLNYTDTSKDVSITVTQTASVITWSNPASISYGAPLGATQLNATANTTGAFTYTPASGTVLDVGTHTLHVDFVPADAVNYTNASKDVSITVLEATAPFVSSITRVDPSPTELDSLRFTVTFSESVTGVDEGDFILTTTGTISGETIISVDGSGDTYTVTVSRGTGGGTLRLDVPASATITDQVGKSLTTPYESGETYTILFKLYLPLVSKP